MGKRFYLRLFGTAQVSSQGTVVEGFESRKALALLCYVALRSAVCEPHEQVTRTHLAALFWGDKSETQGRANLSRTLHNLTTLFPNAFQATRNTIALVTDDISIDACEFETYFAEGTIQALALAAKLYRDDLLTELYLDDCPEFEIWLVRERERWRQQLISVLERLGAYHMGEAQYTHAMQFATRLLELEPWREQAHRQMMQLLVRTGQRTAALQQYNLCKRVLSEEFGVEPSAETRALYEQIQSQEVPALPHAPKTPTLPIQPTSFIGRETEVARIVERLRNPDCHLLTLVGLGGIGKTRLAIEAVRNVAGSFRDGVFFVPLGSISWGRADLIVPAIANAIGLAFIGTENPKTQLLEYLRPKQALLILDNFEHLMDETRLVLELLADAPDVKIIGTSREPLNVQAEWLIHVTGLSFPTTVTGSIEQARLYNGVELFIERATRVDDRFVADAQTIPPIVQICKLAGGMPLAIELAAAATKFSSVHKIAEQLGHGLELPVSVMQDVESRHSSLRLVLDWSYDLLSPALRSLFRQLAIFRSNWTLDAAEAICPDEQDPSLQVAGMLNQLVDKSLVIQERGEEIWYRFLEPVRQYAYNKLVQAEDLAPIRDRHLNFFIQLAEAAETQLVGPEQKKWIRRLDQDYDNIQSAFAWSKEGEQRLEQGLRLATSLARFWSVRDLHGGRAQLASLLSRVTAPEQISFFPKVLAAAGDLASRQGDHNAAHYYWEQSLELRRQVGNDAEIANSLRGLGNVAFAGGDFANAQRCYQESLFLCRRANDDKGAAWSLSNLGLVAWNKGELASAQQLFEESQALRQAQGDQGGIAYLLNLSGLVAWSKGDYRTMRLLNEKSLALQRELGDRWNVAYSLDGLGLAACGQQEYALAASFLKESLVLLQEMGDKWGISYALEHLGELAAFNKHPLRAARLLGAAESFRKAINLPRQPGEHFYYELALTTLYSLARTEDTANAWADGRTMLFEQAMLYALEEEG